MDDQRSPGADTGEGDRHGIGPGGDIRRVESVEGLIVIGMPLKLDPMITLA